MNNNEFVTIESLGTFAVASGTVYSIANTIRILFNWDSKLPAFFASVMVSTLAVSLSHNDLDLLSKIVVILINSCLLFLNALGLQTQTSNKSPVSSSQIPPENTTGPEPWSEPKRVTWLSPW
jgi:hypothetical protein